MICRRTLCDNFDVIVCKIEMHRLFSEKKFDYPVIKIHNMLDANKLFFKVHFMFMIKVQVGVCSVCYITGNCT